MIYMLAITGEMRNKKCTVFAFHPWRHQQEERREGVVLWVPQSMEELIKVAAEKLECGDDADGSYILSEDGGKIFDTNMISYDQKLFLVN